MDDAVFTPNGLILRYTTHSIGHKLSPRISEFRSPSFAALKLAEIK